MLQHAPKIVNKVLDSLSIRVSRNAGPSVWLLTRVEAWRRLLQDWVPGSDPVMVDIPGVGTFRLMASSKPFEFKLIHPDVGDIRIWNPDKWDTAISSQTGQIMFDFRSKFLQLLGVQVVDHFLEVVTSLLVDSTSDPVYIGDRGRPDFCRVARGDLAVDLAVTAGLTWSDLDTFICQTSRDEGRDTLSDKTLMELLRPVERQWLDTPPLDNKGVSSYKIEGQSGFELPEPGPAERAAATLVRDYAAVMNEAFESNRGFGSARLTRVMRRGRQIKTAYFGMMKSPVYARAYDKRLSLAAHRKEYMLDVWNAQGWDGQSEVWRWEFSMSGDMLKKMYLDGDQTACRVDVRDWHAFKAYIPTLWCYLTFKWIRQVVEPDEAFSADANEWRWDASDYWKVIQSAFEGGIPIKRDHSRNIRVKDDQDAKNRIEELEAQSRGCLVTAAALRASLNLAESDAGWVDVETGEIRSYKDVLADDLRAWMTEDFDLDVHQRRREVGVDDFSDTALTVLHRAQRMIEGGGS